MKEQKAYKVKNGIKFLGKPEFQVNPEKGVVVCVMRVLFPGNTKPLIFTGRATRSGSDVFSEAIGKKLAKSRAKRGVYKAANKVYEETVEMLKEHIEVLTGNIERISYLVDMESKFQELVIKDPRD